MEMVLPTFSERKVGRTEGYKQPLLIDARLRHKLKDHKSK